MSKAQEQKLGTCERKGMSWGNHRGLHQKGYGCIRWRESAQPSSHGSPEQNGGTQTPSSLLRDKEHHEPDSVKGEYSPSRSVTQPSPECTCGDSGPMTVCGAHHAAQPEAGEPRHVLGYCSECHQAVYEKEVIAYGQLQSKQQNSAIGRGAPSGREQTSAAAPAAPAEPLTAEQFRKQWSHKPTPIPPAATGLWYSVECVDQMLADFARQVRQGDAERIESLDWLIERYLGEISTLTAERDALLKAPGCTLGGVPDALKVIEAKNDFIARAEAALRDGQRVGVIKETEEK